MSSRINRGPRRVFIITTITLLSSIGVWFAYQYKTTHEAVGYISPTASTSPLVVLQNSINEIDTDGDGLKDWEEMVWGTDRTVTDTDKDGVSDGKEVLLKRNPLVKGPDDSIEKYPIGSTNGTPLTNSDTFSRELFASYSKLKSQHGSLTPEAEAALVQSIVAKAESLREPAKNYSISSLSVIQNPTSQDITSYGTTLKSILLAPRPKGVGDELALFAESLQKNTALSEQETDIISTFYETVAKKLVTVRVPAPVAQDHLALINLYTKISKNVATFSTILKDPLIASMGLNDYINNTRLFSAHFTTVQTYLLKNGFRLE